VAATRPWSVRLSAAAEADFVDILAWTAERFGVVQARAYATTLTFSLAALSAGPTLPGVKARDEIAEGLFTLHVAREGRSGRHFVLFRVTQVETVVDVLRILHDAMDLPRHAGPPTKPAP